MNDLQEELRRLSDVDKALEIQGKALRRLLDQNTQLERINAQLLEALKFIAGHDLSQADPYACGHVAHGLIHAARTAILAAKEQA